MKQSLWAGVVGVWMLTLCNAVSAQAFACDEDFVFLGGAEIQVAPTGNDDTENLQCALDEAAGRGIQRVSLGAGDFFASTVTGTGFEGRFQGRTIATTRLHALDNSVNCQAVLNAPGPLLRFAVGAPTVAAMTIVADDPCTGGGDFVAVRFETNPDNCNERTYFAAVDRVAFEGGGGRADYAVLAAGSPDCPSSASALGTLKVNRSTISGFGIGVATRMAGGAQVDINFNDVAASDLGVSIVDANQNTTITGNTFRYADAPGEEPVVAVFSVTATNRAPTRNRTVIHSNTFLDGGRTPLSSAIAVFNAGTRAANSVVISSNRFSLAGAEAVGVSAYDIDGGVILGNTFAGTAATGIEIMPVFLLPVVRDWGVLGNSFGNLNAFENVFLSFDTEDIIVGPGQGSSTVDNGDNEVLDALVPWPPVTVQQAERAGELAVARALRFRDLARRVEPVRALAW